MSELFVEDVKQSDKSVSLYRQSLLRFSFVSQIICMIFFQALPPAVAPIILLFTYIFLTVLGETIMYRILNLKESRHIHESLIQAEFNLTAEELDTYILKLADIRLRAGWVALLSYVISLSFSFKVWTPFTVLTVFGSYFLTTIVSICYLRMTQKGKVPKTFFLVKPEDHKSYYVVDDTGRPINMMSAASSFSNGMTSHAILSSGCDFKPMEISSPFNNSFHQSSSFNNSFQSSSIQPANFGTPGYDSGGIYTGSSTATGWNSN